mgnify:CR=1 FL=1
MAGRKTVTVEVNPLQLVRLSLTLVGTTPLIVQRFSHKAQAEMLAKQMKRTFQKEAKDVFECIEGATYYLDESGQELECPADLNMIAEGKVGKFIDQYRAWIETLRKIKKPIYGLPSVCFKKSALRGAKQIGLVMKDAMGAFQIPAPFAVIHGERSTRCDMVRIAMNTADIRFRPQWVNWWTEIEVCFNSKMMTEDQIIHMFHAGGFCSGVGEWRPERGGIYGQYEIGTQATAQQLKGDKR